jgi:hypothetical protein
MRVQTNMTPGCDDGRKFPERPDVRRSAPFEAGEVGSGAPFAPIVKPNGRSASFNTSPKSSPEK